MDDLNFFKYRLKRNFRIKIMISVFCLLTVAAGFLIAMHGRKNKNSEPELELEVPTENDDIDVSNSGSIPVDSDELTQSYDLLSSRKESITSQLIDAVYDVLPDGVKILSFDISDVISVDITADKFTDIALFIKNLKENPMIDDASTSSVRSKDEVYVSSVKAYKYSAERPSLSDDYYQEFYDEDLIELVGFAFKEADISNLVFSYQEDSPLSFFNASLTFICSLSQIKSILDFMNFENKAVEISRLTYSGSGSEFKIEFKIYVCE